MAAEPSLGEITSIRGDANIGAGTAGVGGNLAQLPADYQGLLFLQNAANKKAEANKYALEAYREDLKNNLQSFNSLDTSGIMEKDRGTIIPDYLNLMRDLYQNYDAVADPIRNADKYQELKTKENDLRTKIAASKQDVLMRNKASEFLNQHPTFKTQESVDQLSRFNDAPLGSRNVDDVLNFTPGWDFKQQTIAQIANTVAQKKTTEQEATKPFITKTERTQYEEKAYKDAVRALINGKDEYDRVIVNGISQQFDRLPENIKANYKNPDGSYNVEDYAINSMYLPLKQQDSSSTSIDENKFALQEQRAKDELKAIHAQAAEQRKTLEAQKEDKDFDGLGADVAILQRSIFQAGDNQSGNAERIPAPVSNNAPADWSKPMGDFKNSFGLSDQKGIVEGVPLPLTASLVNAYSIPDKTRSVYDPATGQMTEKDNYRRPSAAWVTTEQNPNARKVIVRYTDEESGTSQDLVIPYTENFQVLNNIAGEKNAIKLGGAKAKLLKRLTGKVNPSFEELSNVAEFSSPNASGNVPSQPSIPASVSPTGTTTGNTPNNATTGGFILNADEYLKSKKNKK